MKKVIDGKLYDTETAEKLGGRESPFNYGDFNYFWEALYRTEKGAYFIAGEGNAMSPYSEPVPNGRGPGTGLRPVSEAEARRWVEEYLDADDYEEIFGVPEEA